MDYPFNFKELLLSSEILDVLGFSEYWDDSGSSGTRTLTIGKTFYQIHEIDEDEDQDCGYGYGDPQYTSWHVSTNEFNENLYFLHELYDDFLLKAKSDADVDLFILLTKKRGVNMYPYIESYIKYKETLK